MADEQSPPIRSTRPAVIQIVVLMLLCAWAFWPEIRWVVAFAQKDIEAAQTLAMPVLILIMFLRRRALLTESLSRRSSVLWSSSLVVGFALVLLALAILGFLGIWPFAFHTLRVAAIVPALAGCVLAVCGWRVLWRSLPMFALLLIAIPIPPRFYARLILGPEPYTLEATRASLNLMPNVMVELDGRDLSYMGPSGFSPIAAGEYHHAMTLPLAYLTVVTFVAFSRLRPLWHLIVLAIAAGPIVLLCNYVRLVTWGLTTIYGQPAANSPTPRITASVLSLLLAYGLVAVCCLTLNRLMIEEANGGQSAANPSPA